MCAFIGTAARDDSGQASRVWNYAIAEPFCPKSCYYGPRVTDINLRQSLTTGTFREFAIRLSCIFILRPGD